MPPPRKLQPAVEEALRVIGVSFPELPNDVEAATTVLATWKTDVVDKAWKVHARAMHPDHAKGETPEAKEADRKRREEESKVLNGARDLLKHIRVRARAEIPVPPPPAPAPQRAAPPQDTSAWRGAGGVSVADLLAMLAAHREATRRARLAPEPGSAGLTPEPGTGLVMVPTVTSLTVGGAPIRLVPLRVLPAPAQRPEPQRLVRVIPFTRW